MRPKVIAHRGATGEAPENTLAAFERAIELGADGVEFDVYLTADRVPVVFHYFYLDGFTTGSGPVGAHTLESLRQVSVMAEDGSDGHRIPTLRHVLEAIGGRAELEIELKGLELETVAATMRVLADFRELWPTVELTSFEPALLQAARAASSFPVDLLTKKSDPWMQGDYVAYAAVHRGRLAGARAVHLHPTQLSEDVVASVREAGIEVHAWDVNDRQALELVMELQIPRLTTDRVAEVLRWRDELVHGLS